MSRPILDHMSPGATKFLNTLLDMRDKRIVAKVQEQVSDLNYEIQAMENEVKRMKEARNKWSKALREEKFWELKGVLLPKEIESLCNVSPKDLQDQIDWNK